MVLRVNASFADGPYLSSAFLGSPGVLQKLRDINETSRDTEADKTVVMAVAAPQKDRSRAHQEHLPF